jgi:hemerythrin-like domain-containing protein
MPVTIGAKPESDFTNPIGLLTDCHRRMARFLAALVGLSAHAATPLDAGRRGAIETALRYFREAAPKHTADEEESLFPRLRALRRPEDQAVLARMDALEEDHARAERSHAEIDRLGQAWLASGSLPAPGAARFSELVNELADLYRDHIAAEEREIFPAAVASLPPSDCESIGGEMAARRGLRRSECANLLA